MLGVRSFAASYAAKQRRDKARQGGVDRRYERQQNPNREVCEHVPLFHGGSASGRGFQRCFWEPFRVRSHDKHGREKVKKKTKKKLDMEQPRGLIF
jgi:hypothetical protein